MIRLDLWIGLSSKWKVLHRCNEAPDKTAEVKLWIRRVDSGRYNQNTPLHNVNKIYDYYMYNSDFKNISTFPIKNWNIKGFSTPSDWRYDNHIYVHLQDRKRISQNLVLYNLDNRQLKQVFSRIETEITIFKSWEEYNQHENK